MEKATKIGIATGVASSLLVMYLIDPILKVFGEIIQSSLTGIYSGFLDSLYTKAALGTPRDPALIIFSMVTGVIAGSSIGTTFAAIKRRKDKDRNPEVGEKRNHDIVIASICMTTLTIISLYQSWTLQFQYQITTSFDQHIRILSPYIPTKDKEMLISEFAQMSSEKDYKIIYGKIKSVAGDNNIKIPRNPSYSLWSF